MTAQPLADTVFDHTSPWIIGLLALLVLVTGIWVGIRLARWVLRHRVGRTRRVGAKGEARALKLLAKAGWRVLEHQPVATGLVRVDGEVREYVVRADALVRRKKRVCIAEFKGGAGSSTVTNRATRRQLLEYAVLFDVDGLLLVDGDSGHVHEVSFPALD